MEETPPEAQTQPEAQTLPGERLDTKPAKAFSCLRCFERKVKCDKNHPCGNCIRANVECNFRTPLAPRRKRKKQGTQEILLDRLRHAEDLLRSKGILLDSPEEVASLPLARRPPSKGTSSKPERSSTEPSSFTSHSQAACAPARSIGKLIVDESGSRSRFIENNLWSSVSAEFPDPNDVIADESSEDGEDDTVTGDDSTEFLLGLTPSYSGLSYLHPDQESIFKLWAVFLENINPMTKIIHYPTFQEKLVQASQDIEKIERGPEALMFAIYLGAITSLDDAECERNFGEPRRILLTRYRQASKLSLSRARLLGTGDIQVLQAFVLYLLMMRDDYDSRTLWSLTGVANRIAQSMGIHRDGTALGLPPFETEMRRRLWWQITILDFRSAELNGSGRFGDLSLSDTRVPTNTNDSDIWPGMTEPPVNQTVPTEMLTCLLRCEFGSFWKEKMLERGIRGQFHTKEFLISIKDRSTEGNPSSYLSTEEGEQLISELEGRIDEKFLKHCDQTVPLHMMATLIAKAAIYSMKLMQHHRRQSTSATEIPEATRELLWQIAVKLIQGDNTMHASRALRKFRWHSNIYFQWQALIYLLKELRTQTRGPQVDEAWRQVDECWENHPQFVTEYRKPLHVAVGNLCLKAYESRERSLRDEYEEKKAQGVFVLPHTTPAYIKMLRQQREMPRRKDSKINSSPGLAAFLPNTTGSMTGKMQPVSSTGWPQSTHAQQTSGPPPVHAPMHWSGSNELPTDGFSSLHDPVMMGHDPNARTPQIPSGDVQMDWNQWDYLIQEFETPNFGGQWAM